MLDMEVDVPMAPSRHHLPLPIAGTLALLALMALVVALSPAGAEDIDIYEFSELSTDHPAMAVAVRSDGGEAVVLCSEQNTSTFNWSNWVYTTSGTTLTLRGNWTDQNWYWISAAFRPGGSEALLGGARGTLYSYKNSGLTAISTGLSYEMLEIVWHPTSGTAYIGTNTNRIYQYRSSSISIWESVSNWCTGLDIRPDGGELIISTYNGMSVYNFTMRIWTTLEKPQTDEGEEYYYSHAVKYSTDGSYILASWRSWDSAGLFRAPSASWRRAPSPSSAPSRPATRDRPGS